ncbi:bifunctional phosphopantothenoylcysteine decarboxylase/phosphopantothenate--cysteine ligase CoaBC [Porphyromonas sp. COT-290 OH3588]|uniref:bifunctional phosphopantothenoylcysteine decarboxylase/phosphopantothenate--cysteine ligase CoaBC n=1 Tax=Porphyromonas sp. COT-290 OH3588 TaxID=1515617 RepID=UPI00052DA8F7|nr:bifunctional phosphopantothenoylcysteine decarboxylase/phosphopantothenate--cysteine ligase CoaBC [Porphyromonas sp. COT-290 OH3588]KGO00243.1 phosphopantothenoylcysteine decarboxylase [Porphyromonas sp. COT-290 OH3588]
MLQGKHIVLGITGSIAAYKAAVLTRLLIKRGAEVQIVITPAGKEFITPITLSALTSKPVISEFFSGRDGTWNSHVDIGLWADAMLIAPATASTIGKMAHGVADNMLLTTYLSMKAPVFVAPAMDLDMYAHASTHDNLALLQSRGNIIIEPGSGFLASHLEGKGRMQEPEQIVEALEDYFARQVPMAGRRVLITAGPTHEAVDPVRFIGNHSTGRMGIALADEYARLGAEVDLILGPTSLRAGRGVQTIHVTSALEMLEATQSRIDKADIAIFAAAVADYRPAEQHTEKLKREQSDEMTLRLVRNPDIAATMGQIKRKEQTFVCFALESNSGEAEAIRKMQAKGMDAVVLNSLADRGAGFGHATNKISIFSQSGERFVGTLVSKEEAARDIIQFINTRI